MMFYDFETITHGKWILAGEHSVLRGYDALVFPILEKTLHLRYQKNPEAFNIIIKGEEATILTSLTRQAIKHSFALLNKNSEHLRGTLIITNQIPLGCGLGASAAFSLALAKWLSFLNPLEDVYTLAVKIEDLFHGKSSGLDIIGAGAQTGMHFRQGKSKAIVQFWQPRWYLSYCGQKAQTAACIEQVCKLNSVELDHQMQESVLLAKKALGSNTQASKTQLITAITRAYDCFERWGLIHGSLKAHIERLRELGAIAVKPTGSGGGGYVLSLWNTPPKSYEFEFIPLT